MSKSESAVQAVATHDQRLRSVVKTITFRVIATLTTVGLIFLFTGEVALAARLAVLEVVLKLVFYYFHERGWERVAWGKEVALVATFPVTRPLEPEDRVIIENRLRELGYL